MRLWLFTLIGMLSLGLYLKAENKKKIEMRKALIYNEIKLNCFDSDFSDQQISNCIYRHGKALR